MGTPVDKLEALWQKIKDRDERSVVETRRRKEITRGIEKVKTHEDDDACWDGK